MSLLDFVGVPGRQLIREIGYVVCFIAGFFVCHIMHSNANLKTENKQLNNTVVLQDKAATASVEHAEQQQKSQAVIENKGRAYVENTKTTDCTVSTDDQRLLDDAIKAANDSI